MGHLISVYTKSEKYNERMQPRETTKSAINKNEKAKVSLNYYYFYYPLYQVTVSWSSSTVDSSFVCSAISCLLNSVCDGTPSTLKFQMSPFFPYFSHIFLRFSELLDNIMQEKTTYLSKYQPSNLPINDVCLSSQLQCRSGRRSLLSCHLREG
jgi:hypothetical protein